MVLLKCLAHVETDQGSESLFISTLIPVFSVIFHAMHKTYDFKNVSKFSSKFSLVVVMPVTSLSYKTKLICKILTYRISPNKSASPYKNVPLI